MYKVEANTLSSDFIYSAPFELFEANPSNTYFHYEYFSLQL